MKTLKNLLYRVKRFFNGESGIVVKIDEAPNTDENGSSINYTKDYYGNVTQKITIRNPLGELATILTPSTLEKMDWRGTNPDFYFYVYKRYKHGDKFP